jgi:hypothetical protein
MKIEDFTVVEIGQIQYKKGVLIAGLMGLARPGEPRSKLLPPLED